MVIINNTIFQAKSAYNINIRRQNKFNLQLVMVLKHIHHRHFINV